MNRKPYFTERSTLLYKLTGSTSPTVTARAWPEMVSAVAAVVAALASR